MLCAVFAAPTLLPAQTELGGGGGNTKVWTMVGITRTWSPQHNNAPNGGFALQAFSSLQGNQRLFLGMGLRATGVQNRDLVALMMGPGYYLLGNSQLGAFCFVQGGFAISSGGTQSGFSYFADPTLVVGGTVYGGIGANIHVTNNVKFHAAVVGSWFSTDGAQTPFGFQAGLTFGGL